LLSHSLGEQQINSVLKGPSKINRGGARGETINNVARV
jgi:hypothetical protein